MASLDGTITVRPNVIIVDNLGNSWYFQNGKVYQNGKIDPFTSRVTAIGFINGKIVQRNADNLWWAKTNQGWGGWGTPGFQDGHIANPFHPSADRTVIVPESTKPIVDASGNLWWIENGKVVENGITDNLTGGVIELVYFQGKIYQENNQWMWWQKTNQGWGGWGTPGLPAGNISVDQLGFPTYVTWTWVGGTGSASDPKNWSGGPPGTLPQPGDVVNTTNGTISISDNVLDGVVLRSQYVDSGGRTTLNLIGENHLSVGNQGLPPGNPITVNLLENSKWVGGFNAGIYSTSVTVQGNGKFSNTISYVGTPSAVVNADVIGSGEFYIGTSKALGKLEFMRSVSAGQMVSVESSLGYALNDKWFSTLQVDNPTSFNAQVKLGFGEVILKALQADKYSFKNDLLSMYKGGRVVDTVPLKLSVDPIYPSGAVNFGVSQVGRDVVIHANNHVYEGTLLSQV